MENNQNYDKIPGQVFCVFKTNLPEQYKIDEIPINIQTASSQKELSEVIIAYLEENNPDFILEENLQFEFLVNNEFLRGNLKSHIFKHDIRTEETLVIHYCFALPQPKLQKNNQEEDWISYIHSVDSTTLSDYIVSLYNGSLSYYNSSNQLLARQLIGDFSINCVKLVEKSTNEFEAISACGDEKIRINTIVKSKKKDSKTKNSQDDKRKNSSSDDKQQNVSITQSYIGEGHEGSVQSIDVHPIQSSQFCSVGLDGQLLIWKINSGTDNASQEMDSKKKVKLEAKQLKPNVNFKIHNQGILSVNWAKNDVITTASQDHTMKLFDVEKNYDFHTINLKDSVATSTDYRNDTILAGQEDGYVKIWDIRDLTNVSSKTYKSHGIWISKVQYHPTNEFLFASSSYDQIVKVWDIRSSFPLFSLKTHKDKIFSLHWNGDNTILSGGSDSLVSIHSFQQ